MLRLGLPTYSAEDVLKICKDGIGRAGFKSRVEAALDELCQIATLYEEKASLGELYNIAAIPTAVCENTAVAADLTKKEFIKLYDYYLRDKEKPGRVIYDFLMVSANEKCTYCGGIGRPRNIDHFIPKAFFPQFSIVPLNLVPSCRDCNTECKGEEYATTENEQIIHPYLDSEHFFNEQWISANVIIGDPCYIDFFVCTPSEWSDTDKERASTHFQKFELDIRYSIQAAEELSIIIDQRKKIMSELTASEFSEHLLSMNDTPLFVNHWKRVMYQCLGNNEEFCNYTF